METSNENSLTRTLSKEDDESSPDPENDINEEDDDDEDDDDEDEVNENMDNNLFNVPVGTTDKPPERQATPSNQISPVATPASPVIDTQILNPSRLATPSAPSRVNSSPSNRQTNLEIGGDSNPKGKSGSSRSSLFHRSNSSKPPPTAGGGRSMDTAGDFIEVSWRDLSYNVERNEFKPGNCFTADDGRSCKKTIKRTILNGISGSFRTGHLTAVMGPSGSGKSTMLECVVGLRKKGVSGEVRVNGTSEKKNVKVALINQKDYLMEAFTVREMLIYASRLKNPTGKSSKEEEEDDSEELPGLMEVVTTSGETAVDIGSKGNLLEPKLEKNFHQRVTLRIIRQLGLEVCIDVRAGNCSGGQKKRISIALEMISKPNILILDEPTSGLDSSACFQTVSVMQRLTKMGKNPIAVVATIHQPSARVFNLFDHVYILSYNGHCIYEGNVQAMLPYLAPVELICPQFHNPADFIAEVASGEHGIESVERLIQLKQRGYLDLSQHEGNTRSLFSYSEMHSYPIFSHLFILYGRCTLQTMRDPMLNTLRLLSHVLTAVFIGILYGNKLGEPALCPPIISPLNDLENFPKYRTKYQNDTVTTTENLAFVFFLLMFILFGSMMPTIMSFPSQMFILRKEKINGWYSLMTYYTAMTLSEIPFQIFYPSIFVIIGYIMTGQILTPMRLGLFLLINILMAFIAQSQGLLLGAMFMEDPSAAVFLGPISTVPIMLFGGFFVRISTIPHYLGYISYISYMRYAFEASLTVLYGFDRCIPDPELLKLNTTERPGWMSYATAVLGEGGEKFIDSFARAIGGTYDPASGKKYQSSLLDQYEVVEEDFWLNIGILFGFFLIMRVLTYIVLSLKISKSS